MKDESGHVDNGGVLKGNTCVDRGKGSVNLGRYWELTVGLT